MSKKKKKSIGVRAKRKTEGKGLYNLQDKDLEQLQ